MEKYWYVIKVIPGKERKICDNLNFEISQNKLNHVNRFVNPTEEEIVMVKEKKVTKEKTIYPGYLYFETDNKITTDTLKTISQYEGIMSLMGEKIPIRLRDRDILRIVMDGRTGEHQDQINKEFRVGEKVSIITGPFKTFKGKVNGIGDATIDVEVKIFGRMSILEMKPEEIERH